LVEATQETASFYIRDGDQRICGYRLNSPRSARHHLDEGVRLPLGRGATRRVLLAFTEPATRRCRQSGTPAT
jgi:DNA-binding IclR family transcriptional regulator